MPRLSAGNISGNWNSDISLRGENGRRIREATFVMRTTRGSNKRRRMGFAVHGRRRRRRCRGKNGGMLGRSFVVALQSDFLARRSIRSADTRTLLSRWGKGRRYWATMTTRRQRKRAAFRDEKPDTVEIERGCPISADVTIFGERTKVWSRVVQKYGVTLINCG